MARVRFSQQAQTDLVEILATSTERWGVDGGRRYASIVEAAMRKLAADPVGPTTREQAKLLPGIRSFHIRHARRENLDSKVRRPVHIIYYRVIQPGLIEIVRVLHERMEPSRHLGAISENER
jgi:toxin ParE1/3/4